MRTSIESPGAGTLATIADFRVIDAGTLPFPSTTNPPILGTDIDHTYPAFSAPAVDSGSRSILFFRLHTFLDREPGTETDLTCELELMLNGTSIFTRTLSVGPEHTMHVAVPRGLLQASDNELIVTAFGHAALNISEMIVFFQAVIPAEARAAQPQVGPVAT